MLLWNKPAHLTNSCRVTEMKHQMADHIVQHTFALSIGFTLALAEIVNDLRQKKKLYIQSTNPLVN